MKNLEAGDEYLYLKFLGNIDYKNKRKYIECQCKCGKVFWIRSDAWGRTQSCGCKKSEDMSLRMKKINEEKQNELIGKKFYKLTVISHSGFYSSSNRDKQSKYLCVCECGNKVEVRGCHLTSGYTKACGQCLVSTGEYLLNQFLINEKINYQKQTSFEDLKDKKVLRFDFSIFDKNNNLLCLVEVHGTQHFDENNGFYSEDLIKHDQMKRDYCDSKKIKLIELKYNHRNKKDFIDNFKNEIKEIFNDIV